MNVRLALLGRSLIPCVRSRMLNELARVTAEGFDTEAPAWAGRSFNARVVEYARFTARYAGLLVAAGDGSTTEAVRGRLRKGATELGTSLRATLRLRSTEEALAALKSLYGKIGIEVDVGDCPARGPSVDITVGRCFFAGYYSEPVCRVIEALDQGLVAGLFGGASLEFSERLTGGRQRCLASLRYVQEKR